MIQISETAARKIRTLMARQGVDEGGLRVGVKGGGCSGLSYTFAWEKEARLGDEVFEGSDGAKIFVDRSAAAAVTTNLKGGCCRVGGHRDLARLRRNCRSRRWTSRSGC